MRLLKQSSTAQPLVFLMVDSADHIAGKTGLMPTVTLSKSGGTFASPAGAVTEIANGWYKVAGNATDTATLGPLILHATGSGADPVDVEFEVVAFDPQTASMGLSLAKTTNITGFNDIAATAIVSGGAITTSGGAVSNVITTGAVDSGVDLADGAITNSTISADAFRATHFAADVGTEIGTAVWASTTRLLTAGTNIVLAKGTGVTGFTDLDAAAVRTAVGLASANLDTQLAAVPTANANADALLDRAAGVETGLTLRQWLRLGGSVLFGKSTNGGKTFRDFADSKDRIASTMNGSNERTAVTRDAT